MKKKILIIIMLSLTFSATGIMAQEELLPIDYSLPVIQAAVANQKARLNGNVKARWGMLTKKTQELFKNYEVFKKVLQEPKNKRKNFPYGNAKLIGMRFITDTRAWISISGHELSSSDGFYFIKEDGGWKFADISRYFTWVKQDIDSLGKAIKDYYQINKKLPNTLSDLNIFISLDLFNDNNEPYVYKIIGGTKCILYSFGPNSKDDNGTPEIDWTGKNITPLTDGDIVWSFSPNNG